MALRDRLRANSVRIVLGIIAGITALFISMFLSKYIGWLADVGLSIALGVAVYVALNRRFRNFRHERIRCLNCGRRFSIKIPVNNFITGFAKDGTMTKPFPNEKDLLITHKRCKKQMHIFYRENPPLDILAKIKEGR